MSLIERAHEWLDRAEMEMRHGDGSAAAAYASVAIACAQVHQSEILQEQHQPTRQPPTATDPWPPGERS